MLPDRKAAPRNADPPELLPTWAPDQAKNFSRTGYGATVVARHERAAGRHVEVLSLDHYLEVLKTKPGALPGATAPAQAKASGTFTATHQQYRDTARRAHGDAAVSRRPAKRAGTE
ncbi:hypothetical protein [Pseudonocardia xishanensis]|uniref:Uncharacterized protein n=1 Tax=Pseudonocardia xishanensis TaxID=630995 RepID=A0ABP8RSG3_9PSEU